MKKLALLLAMVLALTALYPANGLAAYAAATNDGFDELLTTADGTDEETEEAVTTDGADNSVSDGDEYGDEAVIFEATPAHPKIVFVPTKKVNSFYKHCFAELYVYISDMQLYNITMDETQYFKLNSANVYTATATEYVYIVQITSKESLFCGLSAAEKKAASNVNLHFASKDGKYSWSQAYKLPYEYVKPSITLKPASSTVYYYEEGSNTKVVGNHITLQLYDKKAKTPTSEMIYTVTLKDYTDKKGKRMFSPNGSTDESQIRNNQCTRDNTTHTFDFWFVGDKAATAKFEIMGQEWYAPMTLTYKVAVSKKVIKPKYSGKITVNAHYGDTGYMPISLTKTAYDSVTVNKVTYLGKGTDPGIAISGSGNSLAVKCPKGIAKGSYKYKVEATCNFNTGNSYKLAKPLTITVKVLDQAVTEKDLKIQKKGSKIVWPFNKTSAYIYPTLKNVNASFVSVKCSAEDEATGANKRIALTPETTDRFMIRVTPTMYASNKQKLELHLVYTYRVNGTGEVLQFTVPYTITTIRNDK